MATTLDIPQIINQPFANGGDRATLPETSAIPGQASISEGIPPECSLPIASGGAYTNRTDANALGYLATSLQYYMQNGGAYTFSATVATAIGGYPAGARLVTTIGGNTVRVRSLVDNNSLDPSSNLDGVNWVCDQYTDTEYLPVTSGTGGASDLTQTINTPQTLPKVYNIADFVGSGVDVDQIRAVRVRCQIQANADAAGTEFSVKGTYPDGSTQTLLGNTAEIDEAPRNTVLTADIPINSDTTSFIIYLTIDGPYTAPAGVASTVLGIIQRTY